MKPSTRKIIDNLRSTHGFKQNVSGSRERKQRARRLRLARRYMGSGTVKTAAIHLQQGRGTNSYAKRILKG